MKISHLLTFILITACSCNSNDNISEPVKVVSWGGKFQQDLSKYWLSPAADTAGVEIDEGTWNGDYATLTTKIENNLNSWDLIHVEDYYINVDEKKEIFEQIPSDMFSNISEKYKNQYAIPILEYGYILVLQSDLLQINDIKIDTFNWSSFWNIKNIPGKRALRDFPIGNIEIALLSEGIDLNKTLYNPNLSRSDLENTISYAIERLNSIKNNVVWWSTGDQLQAIIERKEALFTASWSGRVGSAKQLICGKETIKCPIIAYPNSALISVDWWVVPKNSKNKENAFKLLKAAYSKNILSKAESFAISQGYSIPVDTIQVADSTRLYYLNIGSARNKQAISHLNNVFWSKNFTWINKKWNDWRLK